jgi:hypothetical protein
MTIDWRKYSLVFVITAAIFGTAIYLSTLLDQRRIAELQAIEERISIDTLSIETQFDLLGGLDCKIISEKPVLSQELNALATRLAYTEETLGTNNAEVASLKKQYTLLEIKDYLLMQKIAEKCGTNTISILYFYSNAGNCEDCGRAGDVLTYLRREYPALRVYSFDYNLDLGALHTLIALNQVEPQFPAFIIKNNPVYGFRSVAEIEGMLPELEKLATSTAVSTD